MTQGISPVVIVLLGLLALVLILLGIAVFRALKLPRKKAEYRAPAADSRAEQYAEKLSRMVAFDTVSVPETNQREKFLPFHELLRELFPLLHEKLERRRSTAICCSSGRESPPPVPWC